MKKIKIGEVEYRVAEHKGDISYNNYVKFKQYVPQFWERMDSPLFEVYWEKVQDLFNQSKFIQGYNVLMDYRMALNNSKNSYDAWGVCFALICYKEDEDIHTSKADDEIKKFLEEIKVTPDVVVENVVNFMKASPETFQDHLALYAVLGTMIETDI
jgi:hypothetical protein